MKYVINESLDPFYNLAFEEYVFHNFRNDDYILLWQNDNTVVIGKHQNIIEEINTDQVNKYQVSVVRRITGGGAVYHDLGNLNFSFITDWHLEKDLSFTRFLLPVIDVLKEFGIYSEIKGRNDLVVAGKKISGNAQAISGNRILHHGTLLVHSDLDMISKVLNVSQDKIISKSIKSVRSRVTNLRDCTAAEITVPKLKERLLYSMLEDEKIETVVLSDATIAEIKALADQKYRSTDWNRGEYSTYNYRNAIRFHDGKVTVSMNIEQGMISYCAFTGDFLSLKNVEDITSALKDLPYDKKVIDRVLSDFNLKMYFGGITKDEILSLLFYADYQPAKT